MISPYVHNDQIYPLRASDEQAGGAMCRANQRRFMTHCFAASSSPAENCLISADTKCGANRSATFPGAEPVARPILVCSISTFSQAVNIPGVIHIFISAVAVVAVYSAMAL
jgi:hypothetical protein